MAGYGAYAREERERRWLAATLPAQVEDSRLVEDSYLVGTTLRLRAVSGGGRCAYKLTQKVRPDVGDPRLVLTTNTYLSADEHSLLARLPAQRLIKTRSVVRSGERAFVVDVFHAALDGLVLVEYEGEDVAGVVVPAWCGREVTQDDAFTGGSLAALTAGAARELIAQR